MDAIVPYKLFNSLMFVSLPSLSLAKYFSFSGHSLVGISAIAREKLPEGVRRFFLLRIIESI